MRWLAKVVIALALGACAGGTSTLPRSSPSVAPLSPPPDAAGGTSVVGVGGCPIDEQRFCQEASALANAVAQEDAEAVVVLSREQRLSCDEVDADAYPQCDDEDELRGYGFATPQGDRFLIPEADYRDNLEFVVEAVDEQEFSDEFGGPEPQIVGVSACGGPGEERTYHVVVLVGLGDPGSTLPGDRFLGTYEFAEQDREWAIETVHFGLYTDWQLYLDDPLSQIGCGGIRAWSG